jgi:proteic killer suppression protein
MRGSLVIKSFRDKGTENIFDRKNTRDARHVCPQQIWRVVQRKLDQLNGVVSLASLKNPPGN